jgi:hypothetical protein
MKVDPRDLKNYGVGVPMNCPKCKYWCIAPYYMNNKIVGYECKECKNIIKKERI